MRRKVSRNFCGTTGTLSISLRQATVTRVLSSVFRPDQKTTARHHTSDQPSGVPVLLPPFRNTQKEALPLLNGRLTLNSPQGAENDTSLARGFDGRRPPFTYEVNEVSQLFV
jgi:hypothetical protein